MNINDEFPSKYLKAADLKGAAVKVTIDRVEKEDVTGKGEMKLILYFQGKERGLVLNKTNATMVASHYGDDTDGWGGKELELYPDTTNYQGQMVPCLRLRKPLPPAPEGEDSIPF